MDATYPDKCAKCGGQILSDYGRPYCLQCGMSPLSAKEQREWYQANEAEMVKYLDEHGRKATIEQWHIKPQIISHLKASKPYKKLTVQEVSTPPSSNGYPKLPDFQDNWAPEVQIKWLEVWGARR